MVSTITGTSTDSYLEWVEQECEAHRDYVYRFIYGKTKDHYLADGVTQDAVIRVIEFAHRHELNAPISNVRAFLITTARNALNDRQRRKGASDKLVTESWDDELKAGLKNEAVDDSAREFVVRIEREEILQICSRDATPEELKVIRLFYLEDFSYEEIAATMRITVERVKVLRARIVSRLRARAPKY